MNYYTEFTQNLVDRLTQKKSDEKKERIRLLDEWTQPFKQIVRSSLLNGWYYGDNYIHFHRNLISVRKENDAYFVSLSGKRKDMSQFVSGALVGIGINSVVWIICLALFGNPF